MASDKRSVYLLDTEFVMPPGWAPEYAGQKCDPRQARVFQVALMDFRTRQGVQWWFNPGVPIPAENIELSKLTQADLDTIARSPSFIDSHAEILSHLRDARAIVGQNATCDVEAIWSSVTANEPGYAKSNPGAWRQHLDIWAPVVDALSLFRAAVPGLEDYKIGTVAKALGVSVDEAKAHTALADCQTTLECIDLALKRWKATPEGRDLPWHRDDETARWLRAGHESRAQMQLAPTLENCFGPTLGAVGMDGIVRVGRGKGMHVSADPSSANSAAWIAGKWVKEAQATLDQPFDMATWKRWLKGQQEAKKW